VYDREFGLEDFLDGDCLTTGKVAGNMRAME